MTSSILSKAILYPSKIWTLFSAFSNSDLVHNKVIEGISDYHTDLKNGLKITITLKRDANPSICAILILVYYQPEFQRSQIYLSISLWL